MYDPYAIAVISKMHHDEIMREVEANRLLVLYGQESESLLSRFISASGKALAKVVNRAPRTSSRQASCAEASAAC